MALQVWLPLDGNTNNYGISNNTVSVMGDGITFTDGKIGKAATFPNSPACCLYMTGLKLQIFSWAVWVKINGEGYANAQYILSEGRDVTSHGTNIYLSKDGTTLNWRTHMKSGSTSIELDRWYHVALTADGSHVRFYLDGNLLSTTAYTEDSDYIQSSNKFAIGKLSYSYTSTAGYFPLNGQVNDVRIYDHCLSQAEIHELSKGLVQHFKLDGANTNLLINSCPNSNSTNGWYVSGSSWSPVTIQENKFAPLGYVVRSECTAIGDGGIYHQPQYFKELQNGETYTFSAWARASKACQASFLNEYMTTANTINLTTKWQFFSYTCAINTSSTYHACRFYVTSATCEVGMWVETCAWKLEKGTRATAWCPNPNETLYKSLGYTSNNSGLGRNLFRTEPKSYSSGSYKAYQINMISNLVAGKTYTIQFWDIDVSNSAKDATTTGIGIWWGGPSVGLRNWIGTTHFTNGHADYLTVTLTITEAQASGNGATNAWIEVYNSPSHIEGATRSLSIGKWKIEEGSVATPYCESFEDEGITGLSIPDCSGYGHDGTTYGSIYVTTDSPRYDTSTYLNGASAIVAGRGGMVTDSLTVNIWAKYSTWGNAASCTEGGGWTFEGYNPGIRFSVYVSDVGYKLAPAATRPTSNTWHMLTGVYDRLNQKVRLYFDGVLQNETDTESSAPIKYHASNSIFIGAEASGYATTPYGGYLKGSVSDFRIYCTALSADDIMDLYHTSAKVDKLGNVHAFELSETSASSVTKNGIAKYAQFSEFAELTKVKVDLNTYIEPDGSVWVRVFHHNSPADGCFNRTDDFDSGHVYLDENRWFDFGICNDMSEWELMWKQKATIESNEQKYRWVQTVNPLTATWEEVASENIEKNTTGYASFTNGGLYKFPPGGSTYLSTNNGKENNWWGAAGSWNPYNGRLPAWMNVTVTTGYADVYVRIDNLELTNSSLAKISKSKRITANDFIER